MEYFNLMNYEVKVTRRPYQRSIGVRIRPSGEIRVTASKTALLRDIKNFLGLNQEWIDRVQGDFERIRKRYPKKLFVQGEGFLYRGQIQLLQFIPGKKKKYEFEWGLGTIQCRVPEGEWTPFFEIAPQPGVRPFLLKFYKEMGIKILGERVNHFANQMQLFPSKVSYRSQKTRWGSCGPDGSISLNWRLVAAPPEVLDYVVVHELAHLRYHNHSPNFWQLVAQHCSEHKLLRTWLRDHQYEFDFLAKHSELHPE